MAQRYYTGTKLKTLLSGDKVLGRDLIKKARAYTGYLFDQLTENQKYRTQQWNGPNGSKIQVFVWRDSLGERAVARIYAPSTVDGSLLAFTLLFEAGMIQVVNEGGGVTSTLLHLGDPVSASYDPSADLNDDAVIDANDRLFPVGQITYTSDEGNITTPIVGDIVPSSYTPTASRVATTSTQKANLLLCPASLFTGKTRLYVQALYGTGRRDVQASLDNPGLSAWPTFRVGSFEVSYRSRNSTFLVTTDDYQYFLATVYFNDMASRIEVRFYEMKRYTGNEALDAQMSAWALNELREEYPGEAGTHGGDDAKNILETLVLAQLKPSSTEHSHVYIDYPSTSFPMGSPLEYGWHANWDGSEARIVLITEDTAGFAVGSVELKLDISHVVDGGVVTFDADVTNTDESTFKVQNDFYVWIPNGPYSASDSSWLTQFYMCGIEDEESAIIIDPPTDISGFVLYGWFDNNNTWTTCEFSRLFDPTYGYSNFSPDNDIVCHGDSDSVLTVDAAANVWEFSLSVGASNLQARTSGQFSVTHNFYSVTSGSSVRERSDFTNNGYGSYSECSPDGAFPGYEGSIFITGWFYYTNPYHTKTGTITYDYACSGSVALVIPHNDCDAALGVEYELIQADSLHGSSGSQEKGKLYGAKYSRVVEDISGVEGETELWSGTDIRGVTWDIITGSANTAPNYVSWSDFHPEKVNVRAVLGDIIGNESIADYSICTNTREEPDGGWYGGLTSPYGTDYGTPDRDWELFSAAPLGVCSESNRDVDLDPAIMVSAVYNSRFGDGDPVEMQNLATDGFTAGHSFIGWA